ncbi:V-set and immunoglobulin domain-containing protein 10-like isoform X2 [Morone saxatilis]|uniref:V-set and immunoglobulin domain-containing protein 10-like isoform X2 n=1 Tax=Morone saxatilis TaxID=34816 RepID=UPI0015E1F912|nr:V-set and immunoglobulin domain-containing protein 10-like isoform X2 [Morone saxatilis]
MTWLDEFGRLCAVFLAILLGFSFRGAYCELVVSNVGPSLVNAVAGTNVTLAVSFGGATDPAVTWSMGDLPVLTWTIDSPFPPDIDDSRKEVLRIEPTGSLTLVKVPLNYSSVYTVEMTKSGLGKASTTFTLKVFEKIQNVILSAKPDLAIEGTDEFTLQYSMLHGVVEQEKWFFNDKEINNGSHYSVREKSLVILLPNRRDTGEYTVSLANPFSNVTARMHVAVLYGPDEPMLEVQPAQPFYVSGDSLKLSCSAEGSPQPTAEWIFDSQTLNSSTNGVLNLANVQPSQGGVYICKLRNNKTNEQRQKNMTLAIYERPSGNLVCSVLSVNNIDLQYLCQWLGGTPQALLSMPVLNNSGSGAGSFSLTLNASDNLDGKTVTCMAYHPTEQNKCNITARPSISDSSLFPNQDGTIITLTWEVPPTSVVTGFDIQMKGPALQSKNRNGTQTRSSSQSFQTIQQKPGSARNADIFPLDPNLTYRFRIIPKALMTEGAPTKAHRIGPGDGLSGSAIAGIAAGIPCSLLFLLLLGGSIYLCVNWNKNKSRQTRYPVARAVEKTITTQTDSTPHNLLTGGLKSPPDYNRLQQTPSERSVALPSFVPPPPVRVATTV